MKEQFLAELQALLSKYKADIHFSCEGDTYGIYEEKMIISLRNPENERLSKEIHSNSGFWLELD